MLLVREPGASERAIAASRGHRSTGCQLARCVDAHMALLGNGLRFCLGIIVLMARSPRSFGWLMDRG